MTDTKCWHPAASASSKWSFPNANSEAEHHEEDFGTHKPWLRRQTEGELIKLWLALALFPTKPFVS